MAEQVVDVLDSRGAVIHTYPITLGKSGDESNDSAYETKALEVAAHGRLIPDAQLASLSARIHVSRGGQMAPYGDSVVSSSETQAALEQAVRERAYFLCERDAGPSGNAEEYWHRALEQHLRERAYVLWEQEGRPAGRADEFWHRIRNFEARALSSDVERAASRATSLHQGGGAANRPGMVCSRPAGEPSHSGGRYERQRIRSCVSGVGGENARRDETAQPLGASYDVSRPIRKFSQAAQTSPCSFRPA